MALAPRPAAAEDYRNPRLTGLSTWQPQHVRVDDSLVSLGAARETGLLKGTKKIREEVDVDLERGVVRIRRRYGDVLLGPEYVQDLRTAALAAASTAAWDGWVEQVRNRALSPPKDGSGDVLEIEIPVDFPDAVADIIGQGARLNLRGSERVTFSGTSSIVEGGPKFESGNPSIFPDLDMRQQLRVNLDGTIGSKIHVLVNHDSEVDTDFENKIQLRYDGDDDEVVQKIEMGNTDLSLPGAEFLSFRKSQQGLFGAKAVAKLGALDLTIIASKQEGKTASQTFVGQARRDSVVVRDWEYIKRTFYWLDHPFVLAVDASVDSLDDGSGILPVDNFELFLDDKRPQNDIADGSNLAFAYVDAFTGTTVDTVGVIRGSYHRLIENRDYTIDRQTGVLQLERSVGREEVLACWYQRDDGVEVGSLADPDTLALQLLAAPERELYDPAKGFTSLQIREQKNIYSFGARNIDPESFEMRVLKKASAAGQEDEDGQLDDATGVEVEYVKVLGLDYRGEVSSEPDLRVEPQYVDFEDGTVTFPNLTPFAPDSSIFQGPPPVVSISGAPLNVIVGPATVSTGRSPGTSELDGAPLAEYNESIYVLEPDDLFNREKYLLEIKFTTPTPSYNLNRFNILDGSERVTLNGRTLSRGVDYDIDYDFGILTFRTEEANAADAEISVDFEFVPLFGQAKESLVGMSGTYNLGPQAWLASSWLFFTRATPEERPRLGQEPTRILVGNLYGQWSATPGILSSMVNAIPLVRTEVQSDVQVQGEVAVSIPNPNTKNEIYIDDMEGVEDSREMSITRGVWVPASEPVGPTSQSLDRSMVRPQDTNYYNPENAVRREDVFVELSDEREGQEFMQVLEFRYEDQVSPDSTGWFGILRNLSTIGEDFSEKKFLEIWVNDFGRSEGQMILDMGEISEDFYVNSNDVFPQKGRNFLDTEDFDPYDGALTVSKEDFGLDNVRGTDADSTLGDDADDDFFFRRTNDPDYSMINNFEDNSLLDTEDLDGDNLLDTDNAYLSYVFDLSNSSPGEGAVVQANLSPARPNNHWRLYRIRLDQGESVGGVPRLKAVKYLRLWFDGIGGGPGPKLQIASVKIVGASWLEERLSTNDTVEPIDEGTVTGGNFGINVVNNKEDDEFFSPFDPGEDTNNEEKREQALVMEYSAVPSSATGARRAFRAGQRGGPGLQGSAYKEIFDTGQGISQDFTQYEELSLFLWDGVFQGRGVEAGQHRSVYTLDANDDGVPDGPDPDYLDGSQGTFFFRFGPDTTNFYEFSTTQIPGGGGDRDWREVFINMNDLAELKLDPPESKRIVEGVEVDYRSTVVAGDTLSVYGAPSLARIRRLTLGVKGDDPTRSEVFGEIWVNEIRLRSVRAEIGYASRLSGSARFADLGSVSGGVRKIDSEFRRIEGDLHGTNEQSWNVRGDLKLDKFFDSRGISLPVSGSYSNSTSTPRLAPNSDIVLEDQEDKDEATTESTQQSISARFAKTRPSGWRAMRYTVDNVTLSFSNSTGDSRTPFQVSSREATSGQATYNFNPGQGKSLKLPRGASLSYSPTVKLGVNGSLSKSSAFDIQEDDEGVRTEEARAPVRTRGVTGTLGFQWNPIRSNTFDSSFSFNKAQDLDLKQKEPLVESLKKGGRELNRNHNSRLSYRPAYLRWLRPVFTYDTNYTEDQSTNVQEADLRDSLRVARVENSGTREVTSSLNLRSIFKRPTLDREDEQPRGRATSPAARRQPARATPGGQDPGRTRGVEGDGEAGADTTGAVSDSLGTVEEEDPEEPEEQKQKIPSMIELYDKFVQVTHMFGDLRYTYSDRRSSRFSRVRDRPDLLYQFGLSSMDLGLIVPRSGANLIEDNSSNTYDSRMDTSFQPASAFFMSIAYQRSINRRVQNGSRNKTDNVTFPDLSMSLDGLENLGLFRRWTKSTSLSSSYRKQVGRSGRLTAPGVALEPGRPWFDSESTDIDFSPFVSLTATTNSGLSATLAHNRSRGIEESITDFSASRTEDTANGFRLTGRYGFSAPNGFSFFGKRIRFRSDLTLNLDIDRTEQKTVESNESTTTTRRHSKSLGVKPRATYNFSRKVQGSLDISYTRSTDLQLDRTETVVSLALEALIKF